MTKVYQFLESADVLWVNPKLATMHWEPSSHMFHILNDPDYEINIRLTKYKAHVNLKSKYHQDMIGKTYLDSCYAELSVKGINCYTVRRSLKDLFETKAPDVSLFSIQDYKPIMRKNNFERVIENGKPTMKQYLSKQWYEALNSSLKTLQTIYAYEPDQS